MYSSVRRASCWSARACVSKVLHLCDVEVIKLCEPYECRGYSEDVVFVIGQRRRYNDSSYAGLICIKELLAIHMTRAKLRLYLMLHDMRENMSLPPCGTYARRA